MKNRKKKVQCSKPAAPRCAWMPFEEDEIIGDNTDKQASEEKGQEKKRKTKHKKDKLNKP